MDGNLLDPGRIVEANLYEIGTIVSSGRPGIWIVAPSEWNVGLSQYLLG